MQKRPWGIKPIKNGPKQQCAKPQAQTQCPAQRPIAGQRFREGARIYPIIAVAEADPEGRYLVCYAEEGGRG